jgi:hypothetical protein
MTENAKKSEKEMDQKWGLPALIGLVFGGVFEEFPVDSMERIVQQLGAQLSESEC